MKKLAAVFLVFVLLASLYACKSAQTPVVAPESFESDVVLTIGGQRYSGKYRQVLDGECLFTVSEPESIAGLRLCIENGVLQMSLDCLRMDVLCSQDSLPVSFSADAVCELMRLDEDSCRLSAAENGVCLQEYTTSQGIAVIYRDADTGCITRLKCDRLGLYADFINTVKI